MQQSEEATGHFVHERALAMVVTNLTPTPLLNLPFTLLVSSLLRNDAPATRLGWWVVAAVISTAITLLALYRYYTQDGGSTPRPTLVLIAASFSSIGLVYGMSPWVAGHGSVALVLLFALFPSTASAVGCIVTAGRRDLYLSFLIPLIVVSASTLLLADDSRFAVSACWPSSSGWRCWCCTT